MADGDTLQIVAGHQAFAAPAAGVQTIRLVTFDFTWDDPFVNDDYQSFFTADDDCVFILGRVYTTIAWDGAGKNLSFEIVAMTGTFSLVQYEDVGNGNPGGEPTGLVYARIKPLSAGQSLGLGVFSDTPVSSGAGTVYALVATAA